MEKEVKAVFNDRILRNGAGKFGIATDDLRYIGSWQNFIYEYSKDGEAYILRFTPSSHRSVSKVQAELDWIVYLASHGVSVSVPVRSSQGVYTEMIDMDGSYFTVTVFVKAQGRKIGYPECLQDHYLYEMLGRLTGRMHALAKTYQPPDPCVRRHDWEENYYLQNMGRFVPSDQKAVHEGCHNTIKEIKNSLSKDQHSYGLIHGDIGVGNFLVGPRGITLFDFDEAQYSWFVEDITIPLYYLVYVYGGEEGKADRESQAVRFMEHFIKGYEKENSIEKHWLKRIPLFLRLREIIVYTGMHRSSDVTRLNQWGLDFIAQSKTRIENGIPIVNVWE